MNGTLPFFPYFIISNYDLVSSLQLPKELRRGKGCVLKNMTHQTVLLNTSPPAATMCQRKHYSACRCPARHRELLEHDEPSKAPLANPSSNPEDAGPIVRCPMRLRVCSNTSSTAIQCLRPLHHSGSNVMQNLRGNMY